MLLTENLIFEKIDSDRGVELKLLKDLCGLQEETIFFDALEHLLKDHRSPVYLDLSMSGTITAAAIARLVSVFMGYKKNNLHMIMIRVSLKLHQTLNAANVQDIIELPPPLQSSVG